MDETEKSLLLVSDLEDPNILPGSTQIDADCGHQAYISISGLNLIARRSDIETICTRCFGPLISELKDLPEMKTVPGAREELNAALGVGKVDQVYAELGLKESNGG